MPPSLGYQILNASWLNLRLDFMACCSMQLQSNHPGHMLVTDGKAVKVPTQAEK